MQTLRNNIAKYIKSSDGLSKLDFLTVYYTIITLASDGLIKDDVLKSQLFSVEEVP